MSEPELVWKDCENKIVKLGNYNDVQVYGNISTLTSVKVIIWLVVLNRKNMGILKRSVFLRTFCLKICLCQDERSAKEHNEIIVLGLMFCDLFHNKERVW